MFRSIVLLVGGLASLWATSLPAQDAVLGQKYGQGVHAYFSGDYSQALRAIDGCDRRRIERPACLLLPRTGLSATWPPARGETGFPERGRSGEPRLQQVLQRGEGAGARARAGADRVGELPRRGPHGRDRTGREAPQGPLRGDSTGRVAGSPSAASPAAGADQDARTHRRAGRRNGCRSVCRAGGKAGAEGGQETGKGSRGARPPKSRPRSLPRSRPKALPRRRKRPSRPPATIRLPPRRRNPPPSRPPGKKAGIFGAIGQGMGKAVGRKDDKAPAAAKKPADDANPFGEPPAAEKPAKAGKKPVEKKAKTDDPFAQ